MLPRDEIKTFPEAVGYLFGCLLILLLAAAACGAAWRVFVWASGIEVLR
jgi:hypothetical protein